MKKISARLWTQMLLLIALTLGLLWIFQVVMLDKYYIYRQTNNIKKEGSEIAALYSAGVQKDQWEDAVAGFNLKYNANVEVFSTDGKRIYGYDMGPRMMGRGADKQSAYNGALKGNTVVMQTKHNRLNSSILLVAIPIVKTDTPVGVLIITAALASVKETVSIIKEQLLLITVILIFVSLFLTYYFSKAFTKPILMINEAAGKMAKGNLSVKVEIAKKDELGTLADTINNLSAQLQKIEQLRRELIANVSHEFRTPLSLIKGYAETIRDVSGEIPEKRNRQLGIILEEADRLRNMVDDILNLSQIQSQYFQLNDGSFDIVATVRNVADRFMYIKEKSGVKLEVSNAGTSIQVNGDEARIEQVLYNLVNNAFNHTPEGGNIKLNIVDQVGTVKVEVADSGIGIPEGDLPFIWDRFYKASRKGNQESKGIGLGLAIAKNILEAHKSTYGVESKLNAGTKFWFTLERSE
ncbi:MAG: sensor histidine kinase [Caulobacteraceae bacterium]